MAPLACTFYVCGADYEHFALQEAELSSSDKLPPGTFQTMVETIDDIKRGTLSRAISWAEQESDFLLARGSHLAFALHRSQMIRIALGHVKATADGVVVPARGAEERDGQVDEEVDEIEEDDHFVEAQERMAMDPDGESVDAMSQSEHHFVNTDVDGDAPGRTYSNIEAALHYGRRHFRPTQPAHLDEMKRLFTFILFLPQVYQNRSSPPIPLSTAQLSVVPLSYHGFLDDAQMHSMSLLPLFQREFTARMGVSRDPPLKVAVEVGAGGALNRIIKVKTLMKERGNEWSQADELPVSLLSLLLCTWLADRCAMDDAIRSKCHYRPTCASTASSPAPSPRSKEQRRTRRR